MAYEERAFIISADLGQVNDYTAITIFERIARPPANYRSWSNSDLQMEHHLRHIERPERGTPYPKIIERIAKLWNSEEMKYKERTIVIDLTGVGRPIWDEMQQQFRGMMYGISITGGNAVTQDGWIFNVPKRDLATALQIAFQNKDLKIARGVPEADTLIKELTNFKVKINLNGHDQYEAWREGIHDDIVLSAAMGVWLGENPYISTYREYNQY